MSIKITAALTKRFTTMQQTGEKSAELIHTVGLEALAHFATHQDVGTINAYFMHLPKGTNFTAVAQWLLKFSALRLNTGETKATAPFKFAKGKPFDTQGATDNPFWTMAKAAIPNTNALTFDIKAKVLDLVKRAAKAEKLDGDFSALRNAAIALGIPEGELPSQTDASLAASLAATGTKATATTSKARKAPSKVKTVDPLEEPVTA